VLATGQTLAPCRSIGSTRRFPDPTTRTQTSAVCSSIWSKRWPLFGSIGAHADSPCLAKDVRFCDPSSAGFLVMGQTLALSGPSGHTQAPWPCKAHAGFVIFPVLDSSLWGKRWPPSGPYRLPSPCKANAGFVIFPALERSFQPALVDYCTSGIECTVCHGRELHILRDAFQPGQLEPFQYQGDRGICTPEYSVCIIGPILAGSKLFTASVAAENKKFARSASFLSVSSRPKCAN